MEKLSTTIQNMQVEAGHVALFFLGQAGIIIKDSQGTLVAVDLYLTDCVGRFDGYKRLMPKLLDPEELVFDIIITTHAHYDHFDIDAMPAMMENGKSILFTALDGKKECNKLHIAPKRTVFMQVGDTFEIKGVKIDAVFCDHGSETPYAVGLVLTFGEKTVYIAGDTALHLDKVQDIAERDIDIMFAPINGAFGNLNEFEAITLCKVIKPKLMVPCHYWCFAEHGGNPYIYMKNMQKYIPQQKYKMMSIGEWMLY